MTRIPFPSVPSGEWNVFRTWTAPGMFASRHLQADGLLHFPDLTGGDSQSAEERREALLGFVNVYRPLAALVIFLNVVALEDLFRDLGARLGDIVGLRRLFPRALELRMQPPRPRKSPRAFDRLDADPARLTDFEYVNALYMSSLGIEPVPAGEFPKLYDLALIRHTVAHHGSIVRPIDVPRFQYWGLEPNQVINPPVEFVREISTYVHGVGRSFETAIQDCIFAKVLPGEDPSWPRAPSDLLVELIQTFNFLGKVEAGNQAPLSPFDPDYESKARVSSEAARTRLVTACLEDLARLPPPTPATG